jgi:hypothetical protein
VGFGWGKRSLYGVVKYRFRANPARVRTGSVPAFVVWSNTLSSFSLSKIICSRLSPVRSYSVVSSMASTGHASSHMPQ